MIRLEQYFDEEQWEAFIQAFPEPASSDDYHLLCQIVKEKELAKVIWHSVGENQSIKWLDTGVPALDDLTPRECLENQVLIKRLKECLFRMPR